MRPSISWLASLLLALAAVPAAAAAGGGQTVTGIVEEAIERGYGQACGLDMKPTEEGGYYDCLDFGPYRVVAAYPDYKGFVITKEGDPFPIWTSDGESERFLARGPWESDLLLKAKVLWADTVMHGADEAEEATADYQKRKAAEDAVNELIDPALAAEPN